MVSTAAVVASKAVNTLRSAENSAASGGQGFYTGNGGQEESDQSNKPKGGGKVKKSLLGLFLVLALGGGGLFLSSSNTLLGPAIEALVTEATDTQYASANLRTTNLMKFNMKNNIEVKTSWTGVKYYNGKLSASYKKRLRAQGIEVKGIGKNRKLVYTTEVDGTTKTETITADQFIDKLNNDTKFNEAFASAKRGRVATFFDKAATNILNKFRLSRNWFSDYKQTGDAKEDVRAFRDTMSEKFGDADTTIKQSGRNTDEYKQPVYDANGNKTGETTVEVARPDDIVNSKSASGSTRNAKAKSMIDDFSSKASQVGTFACMTIKVGSMISVIVAANEIYQSINYFMGFSENISKAKAGEGTNSAINEVLNFMSTKSETKTQAFEKGKISTLISKATEAITSKEAPQEEYVTQNGTPLESNGMRAMLTGAGLAAGTTSLFSLERISNSLLDGATTASTCAAVEAGGAVISIAVSVVGGILSGGTVTVASALWSYTKNVAIAVGISVALAFLVPVIAKTLFTNAFENATGIPAGELFAKGASATNTRLGRNGSGQSLSSKSVALAYNQVNQEVIAQDAAIDRSNRSPFDISSKNTFLGSIAYKFLPLTNYSGLTKVSSLIKTTGIAIASLTSVNASGEGSSYMTTFGSCPNLKSIGAVGDIYCNPITTTDIDTINMSPNNQEYQEVIAEEMNCDSNDEDDICELKPISKDEDEGNLSKYVYYCVNRDSPFGIVDQNILGALQTGDNLGSARALVDSIPVIGDAIQIKNSAEDLKNMGWATGEKCGNTENNKEFWEEKGKYYQRYVEDMRLLSQMGIFEEEDVTNPIAKFERENGLDDYSDETQTEYLSRISGLTPENVDTVIAYIDYYMYLQDYDPSKAIALREDKTKILTSEEIIARAKGQAEISAFRSESREELKHISNQRVVVVYNDIRNRSYAV